MSKPKLIRITTVPESLNKLLEGQLAFMRSHFDIVAVSSNQPYLEEYARKENVRSFALPLTRTITPLKDLKAVYLLYRFLKKEKPVIVHTHTPKAGTVGMLAAKLAGVKHRMHTVAGLPLMEATGFKRTILNLVEWTTYRCATGIYPNSHGLKDFIIQEKFCPVKKLKVIGHGSSNGIDTNHFDPELYTEQDHKKLKAKLGVPESNFIFLFVGRMVTDKGVNELVKAFVNLTKSYDNISLVLVGPLETALDPLHEHTLSEIEGNDNIVSVGPVQDVRPYLACSDVLTFPSYREGFPNVVMQAAAMGLPAIVTNINGCNEIIESKKNGLIIEPKNADSLFNAMANIYTDKNLFAVCQENARSVMVDNYERGEMWEKIFAEYQRLEKIL